MLRLVLVGPGGLRLGLGFCLKPGVALRLGLFLRLVFGREACLDLGRVGFGRVLFRDRLLGGGFVVLDAGVALLLAAEGARRQRAAAAAAERPSTARRFLERALAGAGH